MEPPNIGPTTVESTNSKFDFAQFDSPKPQNEAHFKETEYTQSNCDKTEPIVRVANSNGSQDATEDAYRKGTQLINTEIPKENDAIQHYNKVLQLEYEKFPQTADASEERKRETETIRLKLDTATSCANAEETLKLKQQNERLTVELRELQRNYENVQTEYDDLSNQLMDSLQEEDALKSNYNKLEIKFNAMLKPNAKKMSDADLSQMSGDDITENLISKSHQQLTECNEQLKRQVEHLCGENKSLLESTEQTISEMRIEIAKLTTELSDKSSFVEKSDTEESLTNTIESLQMEKQQLKQQLNDILQTKVELLQDYGKDDSHDELVNSLQTRKRETQIETHADNSIESLKSEYANSIQALEKEKENLSLALDQKIQEMSVLKEREATFCLKMVTLQQELHETKAKMLKVEQLRGKENCVLTAQIETLETARADAEQIVETRWQAQIDQLLQTSKAAAMASEQEKKTLVLELQRLETQISDDHFTLQKHLHEFESLIAELKEKSETLEQSNVRLMETNTSLDHQLQAATRVAAECQNLRQELQRLTAENCELQQRSKESTTEAEQCRKALEGHVEQRDSYRTLLNTKESNFKDNKLRLENTISCLLLEKKALEEKVYLNETINKQLKIEVSSLRLKADANSALDRNETPHLKPIMQPKMSSSPSVERKNRRLRTHDERRSQSFRELLLIPDQKAEDAQLSTRLSGVAGDSLPNGHSR